MSDNHAIKHRYKVFVDDNFHYMDEEYRYELASFDDCESAVAACKKIVDEFLAGSYQKGMRSKELWNQYFTFGEDPWIATEDPDCKEFSSWNYANGRCKEICQDSWLRAVSYSDLRHWFQAFAKKVR